MSLFDAAWDSTGDTARWRINEAVKHDVNRKVAIGAVVEMEPVSDETMTDLIFQVSDECADLNIGPIITGLFMGLS